MRCVGLILALLVGAGTLVLTHQVPSVPPAQAQALFEAPIARVFDGPIVVAEDGTRITIGIE